MIQQIAILKVSLLHKVRFKKNNINFDNSNKNLGLKQSKVREGRGQTHKSF